MFNFLNLFISRVEEKEKKLEFVMLESVKDVTARNQPESDHLALGPCTLLKMI